MLEAEIILALREERELEALEHEAALGRKWLSALRSCDAH